MIIYYTAVVRSYSNITDQQKIRHNSIAVDNQYKNENNTKLIYSNLLKCRTDYRNNKHNEIWKPADSNLTQLRIIRGILVYYPSDKTDWFEQEFRWLFRSWIEMQKYEPNLWRTDLIVFTDIQRLGEKMNLFNGLECLVTNLRKTREDKPMCTIIDYISIKDRVNVKKFDKDLSVNKIYKELFKETDVFDEDEKNFWKFYAKLKDINNYHYADSILMAFDGYKYLKNNFDFLLRSDMDVFLTPGFAKWLPENCDDFITGGGGYSHDFNMKRLGKAAKLMNLEFGEIRNLGSTWYSTPAQLRLVSYFTLVSMVYISEEEFSEPERQGKVGTVLWPGKYFYLFFLL